MIVCRIEVGEYVMVGIEPSGKLDEQVLMSLIIDVPEIKVKIDHQDLPRIMQGCDILND